MLLGVVDVGSNTVHLSIVEAAYGTPPLPAYGVRTRLHLRESLDGDATISTDATERLAEALTEMAAICREHRVDEVLVFATAVIRDAANREEVLEAVRTAAHMELQVLSGEEEARFTYAAARRWFGWSCGSMLVIDIGGGSLEIACGRDELPDFAISLPLGAGTLTRDWMSKSTPSAKHIRALRRHVHEQIRDAATRLRWEQKDPFAVGTSKTLRQLARLGGAPPTREGPFAPRVLDVRMVKAWERRLAAMSQAERAKLRGISSRRAHQVLAGAIVARATMRALNIRKLAICPWALREGIILERLDATERPRRGWEQARLVVAATQASA